MLIYPMGLFGWQNQTPGMYVSDSANPPTSSGPDRQEGATARGSETIVLAKGTPVCLFSSQRISTRTAKVGDRVLFRVGKDVLAHTLIARKEEHSPVIIPKGTEVWATVRQVRKPQNWARDGSLSFAFESLTLENGNTVPIGPPTQPKTSLGQELKDALSDPYVVWLPAAIPFLPLMAFDKGEEPVLTKTTCVPQEIADEVVLNKEQVLANQKTSPLRMPDLSVEQIQAPRNPDSPSPAQPGSQTRITEFDLLGSLRGAAFTPGAIWFSGPSGVIRIDPSTHQVVTTIPAGIDSAAIASGAGAVWVAQWTDKAVSRINPETNEIAARIPLERQPVGIVAGEGSVWIENEDNSVSRIDPQTNTVVATIQLERKGRRVVAIGEGSVWVAIEDKRSVVRIDPQTNAVVATIRVGQFPGSIAFAGGGVWVADNSGITRIDPTTNHARKASSLLAPKWPFHLARRHVYGYVLVAEGDDLWAAASDETVVRIDAKSEKVTAYIRVPPRKDFFQLAPAHDGILNGLALADGAAWVSDSANQVLWRIDTRTNKVAREPVLVGFEPVVVGNDNLGRIWVSNRGDGTFMEIQP
jgi:DNA-binding beta-propeller fold protein YncE